MHNDIKKTVVSTNMLNAICVRLGKQISEDYANKKPLIIGLLKGCQPFVSDLLKNISVYCYIDYMTVSSYEGTSSVGSITIKKDLETNIEGLDVIVVDDIVDTGVTISSIRDLLLQRGASSVSVCTLLDKKEGRKVNVDVKYVGMPVPNEFVVGYGLDYNGLYRNLPYIGVLKEEIYKK